MPNYFDKYGVSEVAKLLHSDKNTIKKIAFHFSDYLSNEANPGKGITRFFKLDDIVVISYVLFYWEDEPDLEAIKIGLNRGDHQEEPFYNVKTEIVSIFREAQEQDAETRVTMLGEMCGFYTMYELADSYRIAGDRLVDSATNNIEERELLYPILFNYRHSVELFLKSVVLKEKEVKHNLETLNRMFKVVIKNKFNIESPKWFDELIEVLHEFDSGSTTFRYGETISRPEFVVDLHVLKEKMNWMAESFQRIKIEEGKRD